MRTKGGGGQIIKMQKQQKKEKELNAQRTKRNSRRAAGARDWVVGRTATTVLTGERLGEVRATTNTVTVTAKTTATTATATTTHGNHVI